MRKQAFFLVSLGILVSTFSLVSQNAKTPMMGWSSWNTFRIHINEELIKETADAMISTGLFEAGYNFVNVDDGFFAGRDANGRLINNDAKFPNGMRAVADYIHSKGLNAGIYSEAGDQTCGFYWDADTINGRNVGLYRYEEQDAKLYFDEWNFDFIKIDYCGGEKIHLDEQTQYTKIWQAIQHTDKAKRGESIRMNICRWMFPGTWAADFAGSWRISHDIRNQFKGHLGVVDVLRHNLYLSAYASPGHFNDMDMMQIGRNTMTVDEEKSHFGLWCIMSSPMLIGCDLRTIPQRTLDIITNKEVIALNQDVLGLQAEVVSRNGDVLVLAKPIEVEHGKVRGVALFNGSAEPQTMRINFADIQLSNKANVRDLWEHQDLGAFEGYYEVTVPSHGIAMLRVEGDFAIEKTVYEAENAYVNLYNEVKIDQNIYEGARVKQNKNASGEYLLTQIGNDADNWAEFRNVYSQEGGTYSLTIHYLSDSDKTLRVSVNETVRNIPYMPVSGDNAAEVKLSGIRLNQGNNVIRLSNAGSYSADIDKLTLTKTN